MAKKTIELKNAHLEGEAFYWEGGPVGVLLDQEWEQAAEITVQFLERVLPKL